jgi:tetratricopeptide (TPR) repeat protein
MNIADEQNRRQDIVAWAGKTSEQIERYMKSVNTEGEDPYGRVYCEQNVAYCYGDARHFAEAVRASQRALEMIGSNAHSRRLQGNVLGALAIAQWQTGKLDEALQTVQKSVSFQEAQAAGGHATLRANLAGELYTEGMILGRQDAEPSLGRSREALAAFQRGLEIGEELAKMDPPSII